MEFKVEDKKYIPVYNEAKLEEKRIDDLKTKIEDKLSRKHVNFYDSFKQFSTSYDGHLSIDDIHKGLNEKLNISVSKDDIKKILNTNDEKINFSKFSETFEYVKLCNKYIYNIIVHLDKFQFHHLEKIQKLGL